MDFEFLNRLAKIAVDAGQEVMQVYRHGGPAWQKEDHSPLTQADLRSDSVIRQSLEQHFPGVFIWSEESVSATVQNAERFFLVDPLDGTKEFLNRNGEFTVNIALVERGRPVAGVVFAPALGELFLAAQGLGAWLRDGAGSRAIAAAKSSAGSLLRVIGSRSHGGDRLKDWLTGLEVEHSFVVAGSSLKFCRIAQGQADIYPRFGPTSQWDTAAAQAVLEEAGGMVLDMQGRPIRYGLSLPVLNPEFVAFANQGLQTLFWSETQLKAGMG